MQPATDHQPSSAHADLPATTSTEGQHHDASDHRSVVERLGAPAALVLGWLALMSVIHWPGFIFPNWTPRAVVLLAIVPFGALAATRLGVRRDPVVWAAVAVLVVGTVSSTLQVRPWNSLVGFPGREMTVAMWTVLLCVYAAGRAAPQQARRAAGPVLVGTLAIHTVFGLLQLALDIETGVLATFSGRASGLAVNPVYLGALAASGTALAAARAVRGERMWLAGVAGCAAVISLSGSRVALGAVVLVLVGQTLLHRQAPNRLGAWLAFAGGTAGGTLVSSAFGGRSSVSRVASAGDNDRLDVWTYGWRAFVERPLFGWGPGQFEAAVQSRYSVEFVRSQEAQGIGWGEPHNLIVNVAVTTGVLGVVTAALLVWALVRHSRGPLAAAAAAIALTWILQPMMIVTAPIAFFLLGLSGPPLTSAAQDRRHTRWPVAVAVVAGVALSATLATIDRTVEAAWSSDDTSELAHAVRWYGPDPRLAAEVASRYTIDALGDRDQADLAIEWSQRSVDAQPDLAEWWTRLASRQLLFERPDDARSSLERALELQPNDPVAWQLTYRMERDAGDVAAAESARLRFCELRPDECDDLGG